MENACTASTLPLGGGDVGEQSSYSVVEGFFEGVVINLRRGGIRASFTVRKVSFGQGVERIFPMHSPIIQKVDVVRSAKVRRAKLYFLRDLKGKAARMKEVKRA